METLKTTLAGFVLMILFIHTINGQQANYNKLSEAFKTSYSKEANSDPASAIEALMNVYTTDSYEINLRLGWLNYSSGSFIESKKYYQKAIDLKPFAIEPKFGMVYPTYAMGNMEEVIGLYTELLAIAPNNTQALYRLGAVYFARKEYETAEKHFSKVVNLFPFDYNGLIMLARTNYHLKKHREAKVLLYKVLMNTPGDSLALEGLRMLE